MDFGSGKKKFRRGRSNLPVAPDSEKYPESILPMYKDPPKEEITLEEFERFAVDRLKCKHNY